MVAPVTSYAAEPVEHNGVPGVWFTEPEAEEFLFDLERVPELELALDISQELVLELKGQVRTATTTTKLALDLSIQHQERGDHFEKAYLDELDRQDNLFNQPVFWAIMGIVVGGGAVAVGAWAGSN